MFLEKRSARVPACNHYCIANVHGIAIYRYICRPEGAVVTHRNRRRLRIGIGYADATAGPPACEPIAICDDVGSDVVIGLPLKVIR